MNSIWSIAKRELRNYFVSPIAYIILSVFFIICGLFGYIVYVAKAPYAQLVYIMSLMTSIFMFLSPMLTMRLLSEEKKQGTMEMLYTSPITVAEIVLGKYLGALLFFGVLFFISLEFPVFLMIYGKPDLPAMLASMLGFLLVGGTLIAMGLFASSLAESQIVSAIIGFALVIVFWIMEFFSSAVSGSVGNWLATLSLSKHLESFNKGVLDGGDIFFFLAMSFMFVFLTIRRLDWKRW